MTTFIRTKTNAEPWETVEYTGGGGGGLPSWWDIVNTPGSEMVTFNGAVAITPSATDVVALQVNGADGATERLIHVEDFDGNNGMSLQPDSSFFLFGVDGSNQFQKGPTGAVTIAPSANGAGARIDNSGLTKVTGASVPALLVKGQPDPDQDVVSILEVQDSGGTQRMLVDTYGDFIFRCGPGDGGASFVVRTQNQASVLEIMGAPGDATGMVGFFGTSAVPRPTGVAVNAAGIHAALVILGLIAT